MKSRFTASIPGSTLYVIRKIPKRTPVYDRVFADDMNVIHHLLSEKELLKIAVKSMGLDELTPFKKKSALLNLLKNQANSKLVNMSLSDFADETASESAAHVGGSIAAYVGSLGTSLAAMVANLSSHKKGWDERWQEFGDWAKKGQQYKTSY